MEDGLIPVTLKVESEGTTTWNWVPSPSILPNAAARLPRRLGAAGTCSRGAVRICIELAAGGPAAKICNELWWPCCQNFTHTSKLQFQS